MRGAIIYGPKDVRFEERPDPSIINPTDALIRTVAACVCGSDLWRYRGLAEVPKPTPIGHEYVGVVEAVGDDVTTVNPGGFVVGGFVVGGFVVGGFVGGFLTSDNTCVLCRAGAHANCLHGTGYDGCQAELIRVQNADGTLLATPEQPDEAMVPSLLSLSDVMGTGWHAAVCADVKPGGTVVVVGDGAVGLSGVLAASQLGAGRIIAMSRHADRQRIAREFGATDIVAERGDDGVNASKSSPMEWARTRYWNVSVPTTPSCRPCAAPVPAAWSAGSGCPTSPICRRSTCSGRTSVCAAALRPVHSYLPDLLDRVWDGRIDPGRVFDLTLPLDQVAEGYAAMDQRRSIKTILRP